MSPKKSLKRIHLQDNDDVFLMSEYEIESNLCLQILNIKRNEAYIGQLNDYDLRSQAVNIRLTYCDFIQKATDALFEKNLDDSNFLYTLEKKNGHFVFKWKSIDNEETIINLGFVEMNKKDSVSVFTDILLSASDEMHSLNSKVVKMSAELNESKKDNSDAIQQLSLAIDVRESVEKELYSKFVLVLNEKKRRIRELQQGSNSKHQPKHKKTKTSHILSSDSSDVDGDVDLNQPGPSNATGRNSLPFLDDNKPVVPVSQNRIRNRKVPASKKPDFTKKATVENPSWVSAPIADQEDDSDDLLKCL